MSDVHVMLRKAREVVHDVAYESLCGPNSDGDPEGTITADRLALIERLRAIVTEYGSGDWTSFVYNYCDLLEQEVREAE